MPQVVLVRVIADRAEIVIIALCALPSDAIDRLLSARITHRSIVFDASRCTIQNPETTEIIIHCSLLLHSVATHRRSNDPAHLIRERKQNLLVKDRITKAYVVVYL